MVFYKIEAVQKFNENEKELTRKEYCELANEFAEKSEKMFAKTEEKSFVFVYRIRHEKVIFGAVLKSEYNIRNMFDKFAKMLPLNIECQKIEEITFYNFSNMLSTAYNNDYIYDEDKILKSLEICDISPRHSRVDFGESMVNDTLSKKEIYAHCNDLLYNETLATELDRIYTKNNVKVQGHPVHYILREDNREIRKTIYRALLSALYGNNRIKNKRYCFIDYDEHSRMPGCELEALYKSCVGGAVIIRYTGNDFNESSIANRGTEIIKNLCEISMKYKNKVLTVICMPCASQQIKETFLINCGDTAFVELYADVVYGEEAARYLKKRANEYKIRPDKNLIDFLHNDTNGYTALNLNVIFDKWYDKKLRNNIYPQYKEVSTVKASLKKEKPKGCAYDRLQELIGLESAKRVMDEALNYFKAQKVFADRGITAERPSMHMIFTGNPGTAKTTVARLFAQIMKENKLLDNGDIYEVGRADLVGKYVGWTAQCVKDAFKKAKGGVLFIDEAYSLVDDRNGSYGDEAINTIVQEMENNRADTIVIFAGYPNEMENFLKKNPGLSSRIAFHIPFEDYTAQELCEISDLIAKEKGLKLDENAKSKLGNLFEIARQSSDFGNGRYVRNVIEKAKMAQANRLMQMDLEKISDNDLFTLCAEDINTTEINGKNTVIKIGFCA